MEVTEEKKPRKKRVLKLIGVLFVMVTLFFLGFALAIHFISIDHFSTYTLKSMYSHGDDYITFEGEMAALDFEPGFKLRSVSVQCWKQKYTKQCAWAEYSVLNSGGTGNVSIETIENEYFTDWNSNFITAVIKTANYTRTLKIDILNESVTDVYNFNNNDVRTTTLVGAFDKLGSYNTLRK
jgi:hypothetical protein